MTTETRNEAAERMPTRDDAVRDATAMMRDWMGPPHPLAVGRALLEEALAAERRATVERIKDVVLDPDGPRFLFQDGHAYIEVHGDLFAILDSETAR